MGGTKPKKSKFNGVYAVNRGKSLVAGKLGKGLLKEGIRIILAHIDSPRIDLKTNPLYEAEKLAWFKTQYYGGIKKYQWPALPLALHGVIAKTNGEIITVCIGEKESDPVFTITDLLPHLSKKQMEKKMEEALTAGETLTVSGESAVSSTINLFFPNSITYYATASSQGIWEYEYNTAGLRAGDYSVYVKVGTGGGFLSGKSETKIFTVSVIPTLTPTPAVGPTSTPAPGPTNTPGPSASVTPTSVPRIRITKILSPTPEGAIVPIRPTATATVTITPFPKTELIIVEANVLWLLVIVIILISALWFILWY